MRKYINEDGTPFSKEQFIDKIKNDKEFSDRFGNLGPIYGKQWRSWKFTDKFTNGEQIAYVNGKIDQIANAINDLKTNPDSRRLMVSAWNLESIEDMVLPPCHYGFQFYTRELSYEERNAIYKERFGETIEDTDAKWELNTTDTFDDDLNKAKIPQRAISLMFNMRSNDVPLGLPFNIASYGLLLEIISRMVNMIPDELIANLGDSHIYKNQIDGVKEQLTRTPMKLPNLIISDDVNFNGTIDEFLESCNKDSFKLNGYESHSSIKMPLSN